MCIDFSRTVLILYNVQLFYIYYYYDRPTRYSIVPSYYRNNSLFDLSYYKLLSIYVHKY